VVGFAASLDPEHTKPWLVPIGKFILNFGGIELISYFWIAELDEDETPTDVMLEMQFSRRVNRIRALVKKSRLSPALAQEIGDAWARAERLAKMRNDIAHSPILFGWHDQDKDRPPDFIGCFNMRKLRDKTQELAPLVEFQALYDGVDESASLGVLLFGLLNRAVQELQTR
jgi:hypothetical protein